MHAIRGGTAFARDRLYEVEQRLPGKGAQAVAVLQMISQKKLQHIGCSPENRYRPFR